MTHLDRYLIRVIVKPMFIAFVLACFLGSALKMDDRADIILAHVATAADILRLSLYTLPQLLPTVVPSALFFGILAGYGRLAERSEITALRAAGVPPRRLLAVALLMALLLAFACVLIQQTLQPLAVRNIHDLITRELPRRATIDTLQPGVVHAIGDWRVYFSASDPKNRQIFGVDIVQFGAGPVPTLFHAGSARIESNEFGQTIQLGHGFITKPEGYRVQTDRSELPIPLESISADSFTNRVGLSLSELLQRERDYTAELNGASTPAQSITLRKTRQEIADRLSLPFAAIGFAVLGVALTMIDAHRGRRARQRVFGLGLLAVIGYFVVLYSARVDSLVPLETLLAITWIPNLVLLAVGAILYARVATT